MTEEWSSGDPRVYWLINIVLSFLFAWMVLAGLAILIELEYDRVTLVLLTALVAIVSHLVVGGGSED